MQEDGIAKSHFVYMGEFDQKIYLYSLTMDDIGDLTTFPEEGKEPFLYEVLQSCTNAFRSFMREAQRHVIDGNRFMATRMVIASPELYAKTQPFWFIVRSSRGDETAA